jgi:hypothetical protein
MDSTALKTRAARVLLSTRRLRSQANSLTPAPFPFPDSVNVVILPLQFMFPHKPPGWYFPYVLTMTVLSTIFELFELFELFEA